MTDLTVLPAFNNSAVERYWQSMIDCLIDGILILDKNGRPWKWNASYLAMWGFDENTLKAADLEKFQVAVLKKLKEKYAALVQNHLILHGNENLPHSAMYVETKDGKTLRRSTFDFVFLNTKVGLIVQWSDVSEQSADRKRAQYEQDLMIDLMVNVPDQIYFKDRNLNFFRINPSLAKRYGVDDPEKLIGQSGADFYAPQYAEKMANEEQKILSTGQGVFNQLCHEKWADGKETWSLSTKFPLKNPDGEIIGIYGISHDITTIKEHEQQIWKQANFDPLTGLANKNQLSQQWEHAQFRASMAKSNLALLLLDIDHFKEINNTLGHAAGDELLRQVASRLSQLVRANDGVARIGGDEFAVVLTNFIETVVVAEQAQRIIEQFDEPFSIEGELIYITVSIGISVYPLDGTKLSDLFKYADQSMYCAKRAGRNRFNFYTQNLEVDAKRRLRLAIDLRQALHTAQLELAYQPIVDIHDGSLKKAEVLLRWNHSQLGAISPAEFIPIAESTGWIAELGDWVMLTATSQLAKWRRNDFSKLELAINKSPMQISRPASRALPFVDHLDSLGIPGEAITVEITEGVLLQSSNRIKDRMTELRQGGIKLAIDDFGTGYSALCYLQKFEIQIIKIDKSFVQGMEFDNKQIALCEAMVHMAHALNIRVIAEGVETKKQHDLLKNAGCDYAQGYLYGRPMSAEGFETWMRSRY